MAKRSKCDEEFGYAEALGVLDRWNYRSLPDGEEVINAISKAKRALHDCLELGLNGMSGE